MSPAFVLSITMAIFAGSLFHVLVGRRLWQWPLFVFASLLGFFAGFLAAVAWNVEWLRIGDVPLLASILGALVTMGLAWFFSTPRATAASIESNG